MEIKELSIIVKWCGNEYHLKDLTDQDTVAMLKHEIMKITQVVYVFFKEPNSRFINVYFRFVRSVKSCSI